MSRRNTLMGLTVFALISSLIALPMLRGAVPQDQEKDPVMRIQELEKTVADQQGRIESLEFQVDRLNQLANALVAGATALDQAVDQSRKDGFEWAGPNPKSKTELLNGLKNLAGQIHKASAPKEEAPAKGSRVGER